MRSNIFPAAFILFTFCTFTFAGTNITRPVDSLLFVEPDGTTNSLVRQYYEGFSMIHPPLQPEFKKGSFGQGSKTLVLKLTTGFLQVIAVQLTNLEAGGSLKEFMLFDLSKPDQLSNIKPKWAFETMAELTQAELALGNGAEGSVMSGITSAPVPPKVFILRAYIVGVDKKRLLKVSGIMTVDTNSDLYSDFKEVRRYMKDMKTYFLTARFENVTNTGATK